LEYNNPQTFSVTLQVCQLHLLRNEKCCISRIDQYVTDLKFIAKDCEFEHLEDGLIRDRIVCDTNSPKVKERLLREDKLTLAKALLVSSSKHELFLHHLVLLSVYVIPRLHGIN
jgi:hypothetical protein